MMVKKIYTAVLILFVFLQLPSLAESRSIPEEELASSGYVIAAQTEELELYLDEKNGFFAVRCISSGYVWYSVPSDWESDTASSGFNKNAVPSIVTIRTKDDKGSFFPANSYTNVVKRNTLDVQTLENGFRLVQFFKREGIEIPVDITIEGNSLVASVPLGQIWENDEDVLRILDFTLLPYFGSAGEDEKGYIFVPDGCGSLINFTNRNTEALYQQYVYARDVSVIPVMKKNVTEEIHLPVFGMKKEGAGFIAVIEKSPSRAYISAETAFQKTSYNAVNASCIVRDYDVFSFRERTGTPRDIKIFEKGNFADEVFSVRYIFLGEKESDYTGMAKAYRKYLQDNGKFPLDKTGIEPSLVLSFLGSTEKKKPVAGIPLDVMVPYTPFNDVIRTVENLEQKGVTNFVVKYDGWADGGLFGKYPVSAKPESALGGKKEFTKMIGLLETKNIPFYAGADFVNLFKSDLMHLKELNTNRAINKTPAAIPQYALATFNERYESEPYWILKASSVEKYTRHFKESLTNTSLNLAPDTLAQVLGSNFSSGTGISRPQTQDVFESLIASLSEGRKLYFSRPFAYALAYTSFAGDLPSSSSRFDIEDTEVPFYQIVLKGYIPFSNVSANRETDPQRYKLKLLESGSMPSFVWVTQNADDMNETRLDSYMSVYAPDWIDEAASVYNEITSVLEKVKDASIEKHTVFENGLRETVYDNGVVIIINPEEKDCVYTSGEIIRSMAYSVMNVSEKRLEK